MGKMAAIHWNDLTIPKKKGTYFLPTDVSKHYNFPDCKGNGQTIAIIALGGGVQKKFLDYYFETVIGISSPKIFYVEKYAKNQPCYDYKEKLSQTLATAELYTDIEIVGSIACEAELVIYFAPPEAAGLLAALRQAVLDQTYRIDVISISWSCREGDWLFNNPYFLNEFNKLFEIAKDKKITICVSAGDKGSIEEPVGGPEVWFPSCHPLVLGCGGTKILSGNRISKAEIVWNERYLGPGPFHNFIFSTGGGFSEGYDRPQWQSTFLSNWYEYSEPSIAGKRGVPDVAGHASSNHGYLVYFGPYPFFWTGGTSCSAPLWSALIALINENLKTRVGFINPCLYEIARSEGYSNAFNDIIEGDNTLSDFIGYKAGRNWDPCTGLGSPNGKGLIEEIKKLPYFK